MSERALSFGGAAAAYERHRPGYPEWIADRVLSHAHGPVRTAFEIGAGTGKATRVFAARGVAVTATDPDPLMLEELLRHVPKTVTVRCTTLEAANGDQIYDLVYAAASLHWTDPTTRFSRIASMLRPGGVFASLGGAVRLADADLRAAADEAMRPLLATDSAPRQEVTPGQEHLEWPGSELAASQDFTDVVDAGESQRWEVGVDDYLHHLSTVSAYLMLSEPDRTEVFRLIRAVLPDPVEVGRDLRLHMARRVGT